MNTQLTRWRGGFGEAYTRRNIVDWRTRVEGFREMLPDVESVLEVGCNRGHNLQAIRHLRPDATVRGVEPMGFARRVAHRHGLDVRDGTVYSIPYRANSFDLVLTSGVLIHVPPEGLDEAIGELGRVSRRYVLCIEYASDEDEGIDYRGIPDMLWKRDYGAHLEASLRGHVVASGDCDPDGFERATYWLFDKLIARLGEE